MSTPAVPHFVYKFLAADGTVLYVGCTANPGTRMKQHQYQQPWFPDVSRVEMDCHPSEEEGLAAERAAIKALRPTHNAKHHPERIDAGGWSSRWARYTEDHAQGISHPPGKGCRKCNAALLFRRSDIEALKTSAA